MYSIQYSSLNSNSYKSIYPNHPKTESLSSKSTSSKSSIPLIKIKIL